MAQTEDRRTEVLEEGDIFFLYRPRVEEHHPESLGDVQRFQIALRPQGEGKVRLLVVGRKKLPEIGGHERNWGFVDAVDSGKSIEKRLREAHYETKTRGEQDLPAARPVGEGVYAITLEDGQMHLSYALELPRRAGEAQKAFNLAPEASFALSVKNPEKGQPPSAGLREQQKADYPDKLQKEFRGRRFAREDVHLLDYEGAEFVMIGARTDPEQEYGIELDTDAETASRSDILRKLRMAQSRHPIKPLIEGKWA